MKRVKTEYWNRLKTATLDNLMRISDGYRNFFLTKRPHWPDTTPYEPWACTSKESNVCEFYE
ncbi:hypothetical protein PR048_004732, partial [Dryococelus australis]